MHWKQALWDLLDVFSVRRLTAHVALSAGLLGLASSAAPDAGAQPRVPVAPALTPDATVRKFKGRYVLKRSANAFFFHLAGHRSHSSHSSHRSHSSHSSHSSSSHYSGTHFSSAPVRRGLPATPAPEPTRVPTPAPETIIETFTPPPPPRKPAKPEPLIEERFDDSALAAYTSSRTFNLHVVFVTAKLRRGVTSMSIAAAIDDANSFAFRIDDGELLFESHMQGRIAAKRIPFSASRHRYLRLRTSGVATLVVWETSADGKTWNIEYVETPQIAVNMLHVTLSESRACERVTVEARR